MNTHNHHHKSRERSKQEIEIEDLQAVELDVVPDLLDGLGARGLSGAEKAAESWRDRPRLHNAGVHVDVSLGLDRVGVCFRLRLSLGLRFRCGCGGGDLDGGGSGSGGGGGGFGRCKESTAASENPNRGGRRHCSDSLLSLGSLDFGV